MKRILRHFNPNLSGGIYEKHSSEKLLKIIEDIIEVSVMETKKAKIELSEVNLNQLLIDLTDVFESKKINGNVELKEAVEISERVQIDLVLMNKKCLF